MKEIRRGVGIMRTREGTWRQTKQNKTTQTHGRCSHTLCPFGIKITDGETVWETAPGVPCLLPTPSGNQVSELTEILRTGNHYIRHSDHTHRVHRKTRKEKFQAYFIYLHAAFCNWSHLSRNTSCRIEAIPCIPLLHVHHIAGRGGLPLQMQMQSA